jgi:hypothetical protein
MLRYLLLATAIALGQTAPPQAGPPAGALQATPEKPPTKAAGDPAPDVVPEVIIEDFEAPLASGLPKGFVASVATEPDGKGTLAKWAVVEDATAPSGKHVLQLVESKNRGPVYNLCLREGNAPSDLTVSVKLRADRGIEDRGGGLIFRAVDERNYYLVRWNPLEKNVCAYRTINGRRITLQFTAVAGGSGAWHSLQVTMRGRVMEVEFDGAAVMSLPDDIFKEAGRVGLWTRSDAQSSFDDLRIAPAAAPAPVSSK